MPEALEAALRKEVAKREWSEERKNAYIYGALRKTGWTPKQEKPKGKG